MKTLLFVKNEPIQTFCLQRSRRGKWLHVSSAVKLHLTDNSHCGCAHLSNYGFSDLKCKSKSFHVESNRDMHLLSEAPLNLSENKIGTEIAAVWLKSRDDHGVMVLSSDTKLDLTIPLNGSGVKLTTLFTTTAHKHSKSNRMNAFSEVLAHFEDYYPLL